MNKIKYKIATTKSDFEEIKELCQNVFGKEEKELVHDLAYNSSKKDKNIFFYAYDSKTDKCVGTVCLLDMPIKYGEVILKAAEHGIVATDENYRGQGINKKLTEMFFNKAKEKEYQVIAIEGIPYFYRRHGFNYAVPMGGVEVDLTKVDCSKNDKVSIREATNDDIDFIAEKFKEATKRVDIFTVKKKDLIKVQMLDYSAKITKKKYFVIEKAGIKMGYCALNSSDKIEICDISDDLSFDIYQAVLKFFKEQGEKKINLDLPQNNKFVKFVKRYDAEWNRWYSWQIKILDEVQFLKAIKPVLEKRLADSIYQDDKLDFYYDNFKDWIKIEVANGQINFSKEERNEAKWDFNLSPQGATKLFFGEASMEEINKFLPDCQVDKKYQDLIDVLFPKLESHFYMTY